MNRYSGINRHRITAFTALQMIVSGVIAATLISLPLLSLTHAQEKLSKTLLLELSRGQSTVLCKSEIFTRCMGFTQKQCLQLSEKALQECLGPLPDTINLADLQNDAIEACPKQVYAEAGFSDEKAQQCLQQAMK